MYSLDLGGGDVVWVGRLYVCCHTLRTFSYSEDESFALMLLSTASTDNVEGTGARPETPPVATVAVALALLLVAAAAEGCGDDVVVPMRVAAIGEVTVAGAGTTPAVAALVFGAVKVKGFVPLPPALAPLLVATVVDVIAAVLTAATTAAGGRVAAGAAFSSSLEETRSSTTGSSARPPPNPPKPRPPRSPSPCPCPSGAPVGMVSNMDPVIIIIAVALPMVLLLSASLSNLLAGRNSENK